MAIVGTMEHDALTAGELLIDEHARGGIGSGHLAWQNEERHNLELAPIIMLNPNFRLVLLVRFSPQNELRTAP